LRYLLSTHSPSTVGRYHPLRAGRGVEAAPGIGSSLSRKKCSFLGKRHRENRENRFLRFSRVLPLALLRASPSFTTVRETGPALPMSRGPPCPQSKSHDFFRREMDMFGPSFGLELLAVRSSDET